MIKKRTQSSLLITLGQGGEGSPTSFTSDFLHFSEDEEEEEEEEEENDNEEESEE